MWTFSDFTFTLISLSLKNQFLPYRKLLLFHKISLLILYTGKIALYFGSHREHIVLLYGEEKADLIPKPGGNCSKHCA